MLIEGLKHWRKDMKGLAVLLILCYSVMQVNITAASNAQDTGNRSYSNNEIANDINTLNGKGQAVTEAAQRLIAAGPDVLEQLHSVLADKATTIKQKQILVIILGNISDVKSIQPIIETVRLFPDEINLKTSALRSISNFVRNKEIENFVYGVLEDKNTEPRILRSALVYLADHHEVRDKKWAEVYSAPQFDLKVRSAALYLGGLLGIESFKEKILETLKVRKKSNGEAYMLIGLASLTTPDEFNALTKTEGINLKQDNIKAAEYHYYLHSGNNEQKSEAAAEILNKGPSFLKNDAIQYLIESADAEALAHAWLNKDKSVKFMVGRAGMVIVVDDKGARFTKKTNVETHEINKKSLESQQTQDEFFKAITLTFKRSDKNEFIKLAQFNNSELRRHLTTLAPANKYKSGMLKEYKEHFGKSQELILASWDEILKKGQGQNIDWPSVEYIASNYSENKKWDVSILIGHRGHYYKISIPNRMQFEGKWILQGQLRWQGERMRSGEALIWSERAAQYNQMTAAKELKILNNTSKSGVIPKLRMLASYGDPVVEYNLFLQLSIRQLKSEKDEAMEWLIKSALNNYPKAQFELSEILMSKWDNTKSKELLFEARNNLILSADHKYVFALKKIAENYRGGSSGFDYDIQKAIEYYQKFLNLDVSSLNKEESRAYRAFEGDIRDRVAELELLLKGFESKDPEILTEEALRLLGISTISNKSNGLRMLQTASESGYTEAQYQLGLIYIKRNDVVKKDVQSATNLWKQASNNNHIKASKGLAYGYIQGKYGIEKNTERALKLADKLAAFYINNPTNDYYEKDSAQIWRVHACNLDIEIKRKNDPAFVIPIVKTGRCNGL